LTNGVPDALRSDGIPIGQTELENTSGTFVIFLDGHRQLPLVWVIRDVNFLDHETEELSVHINGAAFLLRDTHNLPLHQVDRCIL
jgi:hypothetical protein